MALKESWKKFGKNTGKAFTNLGKSLVTTARVVVGTEERENEEGKSTLKESWSETGKGFGDAGKSLGTAAKETVQKPLEKKEEPKEPSPEEVVDVEVVDPAEGEGEPK